MKPARSITAGMTELCGAIAATGHLPLVTRRRANKWRVLRVGQ
jgi:hypothetical protein